MDRAKRMGGFTGKMLVSGVENIEEPRELKLRRVVR